MQDDKLNQVKSENTQPNLNETPEEREAREKAEADRKADEAAAAEEAEAKAKAEAEAAEAQAKKEAEDKKAKNTGKKQPVTDAKEEDLNNHEQGYGPNGGTVDVESADGRTLYAQINDKKWEGRVISVPRELEGQVRDLLEQGGFRLK